MAAPSRARRAAGARTGSSSGPAVQVVGLPEFRAKLRQLVNPREWSKKLGHVQREIAKKVAQWAQAEARGMGGPQRHFAGAIRGRGGVAGARIQIGNEDANAAFWGAKQRSGWFVASRYAAYWGSDGQHSPWVGNSWDVGAFGQGPYAINPTIAEHRDDIVKAYREGLMELAAEAFPD
jgi:hypothetical protein